MADEDLMFLFQYKSKYRWISCTSRQLCLLFLVTFYFLSVVQCVDPCKDVKCLQGSCQNGSCVCRPGWSGELCHTCDGRTKLSSPTGYVTDGYGNYSLNTKCSWLIDSGAVNKTIRLRFNHFATECSWDHLYVYDGDSVFAPQIGVFSGLLIPETGVRNRSVLEVSAHSGQVYLYFYSDAAYNMSGFNISYRMNVCPQDCSGHGTCQGERCLCDVRWTGAACDSQLCPNDCSGHGNCDANTVCICSGGYRGADCSVPPQEGVWYQTLVAASPQQRASHAAVLEAETMWVVAGHHFATDGFENIARYDVAREKWDTVNAVGDWIPESRYGHSVVSYNGKLYMFGGLRGSVITDELWVFDTTTRRWNQTQVEPSGAKPDAVVGHTAHVIKNTIYIIFGHSPIYGYVNNIQEYAITSNQWSKANIKGAAVKGGYGHSSVYDGGDLIYIHGGYHSESASSYKLSDSLYVFNHHTKAMRVLRSSGEFRYLHSAVIIDGLMLVFGGNTHNDTSISRGAMCYSTDFIAYDIACDVWTRQPKPNLPVDISRFGHSAVTYTVSSKSKTEMYIFGGFNGQMLNDVIKFEPGECSAYNNTSCVHVTPGTRCVATVQGCLNKPSADKMQMAKVIQTYADPQCPAKPVAGKEACAALADCATCVGASIGCKWCDGCVPAQNVCDKQEVVDADTCPQTPHRLCSLLHNCHACNSQSSCKWDQRNKICGPASSIDGLLRDINLICAPSCHTYTSCENCTQYACMWCSNQRRCVESNSYVASFPYGQCMEWTTHSKKCPETRCAELRTCAQCQRHPSCGWCDDASQTGIGTCMEGSASGPIDGAVNSSVTTATPKCPNKQWYFTTCPLCQCNGHSKCVDGTSQCISCQHHTTGKNCEICQNGYFGVATKGGNCTACECNDHADFCDSTTGECQCRTKGVTGFHCESCDEKYYGNPRTGTCFYNLATDYQFTFNLSKKDGDDKYYTRINFMNSPNTPDRDLEFNINCSGKATMNVTVRSRSFSERVLYPNTSCRNFKAKFKHDEFQFGKDGNTTFFVYVYDFKTPFMIQIAFSQHAELDLPRFFGTFFSCFLSLLLIAAILWKVKQRYDLFRRRQRMFVEMEQMASRPFASASLEIRRAGQTAGIIKKPTTETLTRGSRHKKSDKPSPISLEPMFGSKSAVLSLIIQLPCGDEDYTPPGQTGLCVGSALVTLGNPRKMSMEHLKSEKNRRKLQVQVDNCI